MTTLAQADRYSGSPGGSTICGIAGIVNQSTPLDADALDRMVERQRHRGPDDRGTWISSDGRVGLGHARLSILDVSSAAHQPIANETGDIHLTYNGEIYNFPELRADLEKAGHRFASRTDSEVVVHGYEEWGDDVVQRLRGMFAFAIWDGPKQRLLLARDRIGIKPLYYATAPTASRSPPRSRRCSPRAWSRARSSRAPSRSTSATAAPVSTTPS